jgi:hypothetical protein
MTPVTDTTERERAEHAELQALRDGLLACSPRRQARPESPELQIQAIEHRSLLARTRQRWLLGTAAASALALVLGALGAWHYQKATPAVVPPAPSPMTARPGEQLYGTAETSTVVDLGPEVGRILLRPRTRATYAPATRTLSLVSGRIIAHIVPSGRGFRVRFGKRSVVVKGTLFSVDAETGEVHVWHGVVELEAHGRRRAIRGTEKYGKLSKRDLSWLAFVPPRLDPTVTAAGSTAPPRSPGQHPQKQAPSYRPDPARQQLLRAQQDLAAGRAEQALQLLEGYEARLPASLLHEEACLLKLRALVQLKRFRRLQQMAHMFLKRFPASAKRGEVELLLKRATAHQEKAGLR